MLLDWNLDRSEKPATSSIMRMWGPGPNRRSHGALRKCCTCRGDVDRPGS